MLQTVLAQRTTALAAALPQALEGEVEAVHHARVASRRLREVLPVIATSDKRVRRAVRRVTRAFGPVRELDVSLALYEELTATSPIHSLADAAIRRALTTERARALRVARKSLTEERRAAMWAAIEKVALALPRGVADAVARATARADGRSQRARRTAARLGVLYEPHRLHRVRIAVKRWRYALEMASELRRARSTAALLQLRALQDLLGRAHDLHVLGEHIRRVEADLVTQSRPAARDLRRLARTIDGECRRQHGLFLERRDALSGSTPAPARAARSGTAA
jgi:CHAD domain-containing protein